MDQEKIGKFIKKIRLDHNLSQQEFADMFNVTFQAVSKWERGKNLPDMTILNEISKKFNVDIDEIINGEKKNRKKSSNKKYIYIIIFLAFLVILLLFIHFRKSNNSYEVNDIKSTNSLFSVTGTVIKTDDRTTLIINNVNYKGNDEETIYKEINCTLYEVDDDTKTKVNTCDSLSNLTLSDYLEDIKIKVDHHSKSCSMFVKSNLVIEILATDKDNKNITYNIPIIINNEDCD